MRVIRTFLCTILASCVVAAGMLAAAPFASAKWPMDKPMTIVVPWPAGTGADLVARLLADGIGKKWGNQVQVENKVGATGNIAQNFVAKAAPDGYTFIVTTPGPAANNMLTFKALSFNPLTDFTFVTITNEDPMVIVAGPRLAAKDIGGLVDYVKANPGKLQFGNPGHGTYAHMTQLALQDMIGTKFNLVPYRGSPQMTSDMLSGQIDAVIDLLGGYLAADPRRQAAGAGDHRQQAGGPAARRADAARDRIELHRRALVRPARAEGDPARDRRPDECGGGGNPDQQRREGEARGRRHHAAHQHARGIRAAGQERGREVAADRGQVRHQVGMTAAGIGDRMTAHEAPIVDFGISTSGAATCR